MFLLTFQAKGWTGGRCCRGYGPVGICLVVGFGFLLSSNQGLASETRLNRELLKAVQDGNPELVERLLSEGADPNAKPVGFEIKRPLHAAVDRAHIELVELLLEAGADPQLWDERGVAAYAYAARANKAEVFKIFVDRGIEIDFAHFLSMPFFQLSTQDYQMLIKDGLDLNQLGHDGMTPLIRAVKRGELKKVEGLIRLGADVNVRDSDGAVALRHASIHGSGGRRQIVEILIEAGADVNLADDSGNTPFLQSIGSRHGYDKLFLEAGGDIHAKTNQGYTTLMAAVGCGDFELLEFLIGRGLDVNARTETGWTAVHQAARYSGGYFGPEVEDRLGRALSMLNLLIEKGADLHAITETGETAVHCAGFLSTLEFLFDHGLEPDTANVNGDTPLHRSVEIIVRSQLSSGERFMMARRLLEAGADVNAMNREGVTPLMRAVSEMNTALIEFLLEQGADADVLTPNGQSLLNLVANAFHDRFVDPGDYAKVVANLATEMENVDRQCENDMTPLMWAAAANNVPAVEALLDAGADFEARSGDGRTPLMWAASARAEDVMELLLERGTDPSIEDRQGRTAADWKQLTKPSAPDTLPPGGSSMIEQRAPASFIAAVFHSDLDAVRTFLAEGADANGLYLGATGLHLAAEKGDWAISKLLLDKGADINALDINRETPLMWAIANGHLDLAQLLVDEGAGIDHQSHFDQTALGLAVQMRQKATAEFLLRAGADISLAAERSPGPFVSAVAWGDPDVVRLFLDRVETGVALEDDDHGCFLQARFSPFEAAATGSVEVMNLLLEYAANQPGLPHQLCLALHQAARYGNLEMVRHLVDETEVDIDCHSSVTRGAAVTVDTREGSSSSGTEGFTPLSRAIEYGQNPVMRFLLERGARVEGRTNNGSSLLIFAIERRDRELFELLLEYNAPVDATDLRGRTALMHAAASGEGELAHLLLKKAASLTLEDEQGLTPLMHAAVAGQTNVCELFIKQGAEVDAQSSKTGRTALHEAARSGHAATVQALLDHSASTRLTDHEERTARVLAERARYPNIAEILEAAGKGPGAPHD